MNPDTYSDLSDYQDPQHVEHLLSDTDARRMNLCPWCGGQAHGYSDCPDKPPVCPECGGRGQNPYCPYCDGTGSIY